MAFEIFSFVLGLLVGSFLNVCIVRLPKEESVVRPSSHCPKCNAPIRWYDNIPLLSWLVLGGRCRNPECRARISLQYPAVELLTGLLFWAVARNFGASLEAAKWALLLCLLIVHAVTDLRARFLSYRMNLLGIAMGLAASTAVPLRMPFAATLGEWFYALPPWAAGALVGLAEGLLGSAFGAGLLWLVSEGYFRLTRREGMGLGDVYLMGMIGAFVGVKLTFLTILVGSLLGSIIGVMWITALFASGWKRRVAERAARMGRGDATKLRFALARRYPLPFGTYLSIAAGLLIFCGTELLYRFSVLIGAVE